ncbi:MAG: EF-hand protein [Rhodospirillales bacterium]|nr:EF-hand protein [Rhodospirillales bacterium]
MQVSSTSGSSITQLMTMLQQLYHPDSGSTASTSSTVAQQAATATAVSNSIAASKFLGNSSLSNASLMTLLQSQSFDDAATSRVTGQASDATYAKWAATADKNGNGLISKAEFEAAVPSNITTAQADQLFAGIDTKGTGSVTATQLRQGLAAAIAAGPVQAAPTGGTHRLFAALDTNGDGHVTKAELEKDRASGLTKKQADAVFAKLDTNGDGTLTPAEFAQALVGSGAAAASAGTASNAAGSSSQARALQILSQLASSSTSSTNSLLDNAFTSVVNTLGANQQSANSIQNSTDSLASFLAGLG